MKFAPKTEQELQQMRLLPAGTYAFDVLNATDALSKAGNEMIKLELLVYTPDGSTRKVTDYLMEKLAYKLAGFAKHTGLSAKYTSGHIAAEDCLGKSGWVQLTVEEGKPKPDKPGEKFSDRNSVKGYCDKPGSRVANLTAPRANKPAEKAADAAAASASNLDEDVPF